MPYPFIIFLPFVTWHYPILYMESPPFGWVQHHLRMFQSLTVQLLCLGSSSLVRCQPPPQAAPRVYSMFESRNSAAPFSPQSNAVFWLKSLKAPRENKVIPIRTSPHFIYFGILPGTVPFAALSLPLVFHGKPCIPAISAVTPAP